MTMTTIKREDFTLKDLEIWAERYRNWTGDPTPRDDRPVVGRKLYDAAVAQWPELAACLRVAE